jgi:DNA-binding NarL/FixJ family response regulator
MSSAKTKPETTWRSSWQQTHQLVNGARGVHGRARAEATHAVFVDEAGLHEPIAMLAANDDRRVNSVMAAGAVRHIFAEANEVDLAVLMRSIELGNSPVASQIARRILGSIAAPAEPRPCGSEAQRVEEVQPFDTPKSKTLVSPRELKVLRLIARGWSNQQIAEATLRSINTIEAQLKSIYRKLAVKSRTQAVREAMQQGLLDWEGQHERAAEAEARTHCVDFCSCANRTLP